MNLFITEWANSPRPRGRKNSHAFVSDRIELKSLKAQPRALSEKKKKKNRKREPARNRGERSIPNPPPELLMTRVWSLQSILVLGVKDGPLFSYQEQDLALAFPRLPQPAATALQEHFPLG